VANLEGGGSWKFGTLYTRAYTIHIFTPSSSQQSIGTEYATFTTLRPKVVSLGDALILVLVVVHSIVTATLTLDQSHHG
jgi:hypothetical protein